jgi:hypothetical protein
VADVAVIATDPDVTDAARVVAAVVPDAPGATPFTVFDPKEVAVVTSMAEGPEFLTTVVRTTLPLMHRVVTTALTEGRDRTVTVVVTARLAGATSSSRVTSSTGRPSAA